MAPNRKNTARVASEEVLGKSATTHTQQAASADITGSEEEPPIKKVKRQAATEGEEAKAISLIKAVAADDDDDDIQPSGTMAAATAVATVAFTARAATAAADDDDDEFNLKKAYQDVALERKIKPGKSWIVAQRITLKSGYVGSHLLFSMSTPEEDRVFLTIDEYFALRKMYPLISASTGAVLRLGDSDNSVQTQTDQDGGVTVQSYRVNDLQHAGQIKFTKAEFAELDKALNQFWHMFKVIPRNIVSSELTRDMFRCSAAALVGLIDQCAITKPVTYSFKCSKFRKAFFNSYALLTNFQANYVVKQLEKKFAGNEKALGIDMYGLFYQSVNQLDVLFAFAKMHDEATK